MVNHLLALVVIMELAILFNTEVYAAGTVDLHCFSGVGLFGYAARVLFRDWMLAVVAVGSGCE